MIFTRTTSMTSCLMACGSPLSINFVESSPMWQPIARADSNASIMFASLLSGSWLGLSALMSTVPGTAWLSRELQQAHRWLQYMYFTE